MPQPVYVQPQQQYLTQPQYLTTTAGPTPITDGGEVLLFSPSTNQSDVHYALNGHRFTMPPGTKQRLTNDRVWTIQFESSPGQLATYTLSSSRYKFKPTDGGTGLFETQDTPEVVQPGLPPTPGLPPAPIPNPPEVPTLKTTP